MRAQSSIVTELILIMITLSLSAIVLAVVNNLMSMLGKVPFYQLPHPIGVYDAQAYISPTGGEYVLVAIRVAEPTTLDGVYVYYEGTLVCSSTEFLLSSADPSAKSFGCRALVPAGYYGEFKEQKDPYDAPCPGAMFFALNCTQPVEAISYNDLWNGWYPPYSPDTGEEANAWATVVNAVPGAFVSTWCETQMIPTFSTLKFVNALGTAQKALYNGTTWLTVPRFKSVRLDKGTFTVVLWCPHLNVPIDELKVVLRTDVGDVEALPQG